MGRMLFFQTRSFFDALYAEEVIFYNEQDAFYSEPNIGSHHPEGKSVPLP